jgi:translation initiation factor 2D
VRAWLVSSGGVADDATAVQIAAALAADGFDSLGALAVGALTVDELQTYGAGATTANAIVDAIATLKLLDGTPTPPPAPSAGGSVGTGLPDFDPAAVPLDELLLNALVKLAGGAKKGTTFATHMSLAELKASLKERMTAFHRVEVQGEAPSIRKGALKPISIEMKRAAGHNKTHVSGLESFCISPQAVSDALKVKLGCTTAVLKLPGNNTKDVEVLLQGHCVNEVCDYLRDVYCIEKQWIELKLKESKRSNT